MKLKNRQYINYRREANCLALGSDNKHVVKLTEEQKLEVWDFESGFLSYILDMNNSMFPSSILNRRRAKMVLSHDGKKALIFDLYAFCMVDLQKRKYTLHKSPFFKEQQHDPYTFVNINMLLSLNDEYFLLGREDELKVCSFEGQKLLFSRVWEKNNISTLAINSRSVYIAMGSEEGNITVFSSLNRIYGLEILNAHESKVTALLFTEDTELIISAGEDGKVKAWNFHTGDLLYEIDVLNDAVTALSFTTDYKKLLITSKKELVSINMEDKKRSFRLNVFKDDFYAFKMAVNNHFIVTDSSDRGMELWSIEEGVKVKDFGKSVYYPESLYKMPYGSNLSRAYYITDDNRYILYSLSNHKLALWDMQSLSLMNSFREIEGVISSVTISPNLEYLVYSTTFFFEFRDNLNHIHLLDFKTQELLYSFEIEKNDEVILLKVTPDSKEIVAVLQFGTVKRWDIESLNLISSSDKANFIEYYHDLLAITLSDDTHYVAYIYYQDSWMRKDLLLVVVDTKLDKRVEISFIVSFELEFPSIEISDDNRYIDFYDHYQHLLRWDREEEKIIFKVDYNPPVLEAFKNNLIRSVLSKDKTKAVNFYSEPYLLSIWNLKPIEEHCQLFVGENNSSIVIDKIEDKIYQNSDNKLLYSIDKKIEKNNDKFISFSNS